MAKKKAVKRENVYSYHFILNTLGKYRSSTFPHGILN